MKDPTAYSVFLWAFTLLLTGRVAGQLIDAAVAPAWLGLNVPA